MLAVRQAWAHAVFTPPRPLPAQDIAVTGQQLVPLAGALALAALACLAAVIATRSVIRRAFGVLLVLLGAGAAVAAVAAVRTPAVLAAARGVGGALTGPLGGSTTSGAPSGGAVHEIIIAGPGRVILAGAPWRAAVLAGAAAIVLAGLATAWHGPRWPAMGVRFERPAGPPAAGSPAAGSPAAGRPASPPRAEADSATMWESLSRDVDPTVDDATRG